MTSDSVSQMRDQSEASENAAETVTQVSTTRRQTTSCLVPKTTEDMRLHGNVMLAPEMRKSTEGDACHADLDLLFVDFLI